MSVLITRLLILFYFLCYASLFAQQLDEGKVVFVSTVEKNNTEIFICDIDGSNEKQITHNPGEDSWPSCSPDGQQVAYVSLQNNENESGIYVMNIDGTHPYKLVSDGCNPKWSPDGKWIAYERYRDTSWAITLIGPDGKTIKELLSHHRPLINYTWSSDSKQIAFVSDKDGEEYEIYIIGVDSPHHVKRITDNNTIEKFLAWSPDGKRIAYNFQDGKGKEYALYIMNVDGSGQKKLLDKASMPDWIDNEQLLCEVNLNGHWEVALFNIETNQLVPITHLKKYSGDPSWCPATKDK